MLELFCPLYWFGTANNQDNIEGAGSDTAWCGWSLQALLCSCSQTICQYEKDISTVLVLRSLPWLLQFFLPISTIIITTIWRWIFYRTSPSPLILKTQLTIWMGLVMGWWWAGAIQAWLQFICKYWQITVHPWPCDLWLVPVRQSSSLLTDTPPNIIKQNINSSNINQLQMWRVKTEEWDSQGVGKVLFRSVETVL